MTMDSTQPALPANEPEAGNQPIRTLVFKTRFHRRRRREKIAFEEGPPPAPREPVRRPARIAITLALGHKIEQAILEGKLKDRADAARRLGLSRARLSQICDLTLLPVAEQERILFLEASEGTTCAARNTSRSD